MPTVTSWHHRAPLPATRHRTDRFPHAASPPKTFPVAPVGSPMMLRPKPAPTCCGLEPRTKPRSDRPVQPPRGAPATTRGSTGSTGSTGYRAYKALRALRTQTVVVLDSEGCEGSEVSGTGKFKEVPASQGKGKRFLFSVAEGVRVPNAAHTAHRVHRAASQKATVWAPSPSRWSPGLFF
jgi:hypothetical protein